MTTLAQANDIRATEMIADLLREFPRHPEFKVTYCPPEIGRGLTRNDVNMITREEVAQRRRIFKVLNG